MLWPHRAFENQTWIQRTILAQAENPAVHHPIYCQIYLIFLPFGALNKLKFDEQLLFIASSDTIQSVKIRYEDENKFWPKKRILPHITTSIVNSSLFFIPLVLWTSWNFMSSCSLFWHHPTRENQTWTRSTILAQEEKPAEHRPIYFKFWLEHQILEFEMWIWRFFFYMANDLFGS